MNEQPELDALKEAVKRARLSIPEHIKDICARSGVSPGTWRRVENGVEVSPHSLRKVEKALGWPQGTAQAILAGDLSGLDIDDRINPDLSQPGIRVQAEHQRDDLIMPRPPGLTDEEWARRREIAREIFEWELGRMDRERRRGGV